MNNKQIERIRITAKRTLKILDLIEQGLSVREIVEKTGADRQLVDYYIKITKENQTTGGDKKAKA